MEWMCTPLWPRSTRPLMVTRRGIMHRFAKLIILGLFRPTRQQRFGALNYSKSQSQIDLNPNPAPLGKFGAWTRRTNLPGASVESASRSSYFLNLSALLFPWLLRSLLRSRRHLPALLKPQPRKNPLTSGASPISGLWSAVNDSKDRGTQTLNSSGYLFIHLV